MTNGTGSNLPTSEREVKMGIVHPVAVQVSVVIPAYNQAQFLEGAIRSVLEQTCPPYEIIVVDDGSTDSTPQVVEPFGSQVKYVWQPNQGLAGARNTGIQLASGEYIALLDSDDEWLPGYLKTMTALAQANPEAAVLYCPVVYMDVAGRTLPQTPAAPMVPASKLYQSLLRANFLVPSTILMRRSVAEAAGLFDPAFRRLQDWEFWLRLLRDGHIFVGSHERLVRYRLHGSNLSKDPAGGQQAVLAMVTKLFGQDDGMYSTWPGEKRRAYGGAYRYHVLSSVQLQDDWLAAARYLRKALQIDPTLALDVDLFYELALGSQPMGYRGALVQNQALKEEKQRHALQDNAANLNEAIELVFRTPLPPTLDIVRHQVWGTAYQALGLVAYNAGQLPASRRYLLTALRYRPDLLRNKHLAALLSKSLVGRSSLSLLRQLRRRVNRLPVIPDRNHG